jgi:MFS family permease
VKKTSGKDNHGSSQAQKQLRFRQLLTYPVILSISNYVCLSFLDISFNALYPLFLTMPIHIGGLGFPPSTIGYIIGANGVAIGLFQFFFFAKLMRRFGERRMFLNGMWAFVPAFGVMPVMNALARKDGMDAKVWVLVGVVVVLAVLMDISFGR